MAPDPVDEESTPVPARTSTAKGPSSPGGFSSATSVQQTGTHWFVAANNYLSAKHAAMRRFELLLDQVPDSMRWRNDQTLELRDDETDSGDVDVHVIMDFPPSDDRSFFCIGVHDPDTKVPKYARPAYNIQGHAESQWRRLSDMHIQPILFPSETSSYCGRVQQGGLHNAYFVHALQALSLRPKLLRDVFAFTNVMKGIYVLLFYKNGQYCCAEVDDYVPCDAQGYPVPCTSDQFPQVMWPSIAEKAYAKLHCNGRLDSAGWEIVGEGGSIEECLVDLTGGVGGNWYCCDISPDRLFVYLHQLQREAIFCCSIDEKQCVARGVKLYPCFCYTVNRVAEHEGQGYVQMHCNAPFIADGGLSLNTPYTLIHHRLYPEDQADGFFWISVDALCFENYQMTDSNHFNSLAFNIFFQIYDFAVYFDMVYECRLVNSGDRGAILNMPEPRLPYTISPCFVREPMYEIIQACANEITVKNAPEFLITYLEEDYCEVHCCVMQTDERLSQAAPGQRYLHIPILLKCYEQVDGRHFCSITKSNWQYNARDSTLAFKLPKPGVYLIVCELLNQIPEKNKYLDALRSDGLRGELSVQTKSIEDEDVVLNKLIFRCYSTRKVHLTINSKPGNHTLIAPRADYPRATRWSFIGSRNPEYMLRPDLPEEYDDTEGFGVPHASSMDLRELENLRATGNPEGAKCSIM